MADTCLNPAKDYNKSFILGVRSEFLSNIAFVLQKSNTNCMVLAFFSITNNVDEYFLVCFFLTLLVFLGVLLSF